MPPRYFNRIKNSLWCCFFSFFIYLWHLLHSSFFTMHNFIWGAIFAPNEGAKRAPANAAQLVARPKTNEKAEEAREEKFIKMGKRVISEKGKKNSLNWHFIINKLKVRLPFTTNNNRRFNFSSLVSVCEWRTKTFVRENKSRHPICWLVEQKLGAKSKWNCPCIDWALDQLPIHHRRFSDSQIRQQLRQLSGTTTEIFMNWSHAIAGQMCRVKWTQDACIFKCVNWLDSHHFN